MNADGDDMVVALLRGLRYLEYSRLDLDGQQLIESVVPLQHTESCEALYNASRPELKSAAAGRTVLIGFVDRHSS